MQTRDRIDFVKGEILRQMTEGIGHDRLEQVIKEINNPTYKIIVLTADEVDALQNASSQTAATSLELQPIFLENQQMKDYNNRFRERIKDVKALAKERGFNASQALGVLDRMTGGFKP